MTTMTEALTAIIFLLTIFGLYLVGVFIVCLYVWAAFIVGLALRFLRWIGGRNVGR